MDGLPRWATRVLGSDGHRRVEETIARAEARTSGEIVPLIVRRSSTVGHVPLLASALILLAAIIADLPGLIGNASGQPTLGIALVWLGSVIAGHAASRLDLVDRLLTPQGDQAHQVDLRAQIEFAELGMDHTDGRTGVLLMVSLLEHRAVVLADRGISEKLDANIWQDVVDLMIDGVKSRDLASGLCSAIERCGELLGEHFPIEAGDENELRDHLIIKG